MAAPQRDGGATSGGLIRLLERASAGLNKVLVWIAALMLGAMMLFAVADMIARQAGVAFGGSYEVIGWMSAAAMALALGTVQRDKGHVAMDLFVARLGRRSRALVDASMAALSFALFATVSFTVLRYGLVLHDSGSMSETLRVIVYPWVYVVGAGCAGLALALLADLVRAFAALHSAPGG